MIHIGAYLTALLVVLSRRQAFALLALQQGPLSDIGPGQLAAWFENMRSHATFLSVGRNAAYRQHKPASEPRGVEHPGSRFRRAGVPMSGKSNKRGREIRKPKQAPKPKPAKDGTDASRILRQANLPRSSKQG